MTSTMQIAVDPGNNGAIALLENGRYRNVWSMPKEPKRTKGFQIDVVELLDLAASIALLCEGHPIDLAFESVGSMPRQGVSTTFAFGDAFGCARMFAGMFKTARIYPVPPARWKGEMRLTKVKAFSLVLARRAYPEARAELKLAKHEGRAEALMLAGYLHRITQPGWSPAAKKKSKKSKKSKS